jgi:hypothetical protein
MPSPPLLRRLKERKLMQWALWAFVVFRLLDALEVPLGLPPTLQRAILVMVGIGFPITLVLAWYHGEKGRQRVSGPELLMVQPCLVWQGQRGPCCPVWSLENPLHRLSPTMAGPPSEAGAGVGCYLENPTRTINRTSGS